MADKNLHPRSQDAATAPEVPPELAVHLEHDQRGPTVSTADKEVAAFAPGDPDIDNPETDQAVTDIVEQESDQLLASQGDTMPQVVTKRRGFWRRMWHNSFFRWTILLLVLSGIGAAAVIPRARYAVLNMAGVRSSASIVVLDNTTQLPLKNVSVRLGSLQTSTNSKGEAVFRDLRLGDYELLVQRIAFSSYKQKVTIGWGSNPLGNFKLRAVGTQYTLHIVDYFSGRPIVGAEASSDVATALSDTSGKLVLTVSDSSLTTLTLNVAAAGYRQEIIGLNAADAKTAVIALLPDYKTIFVSKKAGTFDVYSSDLDGKNAKLLLAGTGSELANMSLVVSPDNTQAALVSTRGNARSNDGVLLQVLTFIDIAKGTSTSIDRAEQIQLIDWIGDRLVYRTTVAGAAESDPLRSRLLAYNYMSNARTQLATANQFNTVNSARSYIYYGVSSSDADARLGLFRVKPDGSGREQLSDQEVWTTIRTAYDTLALQTASGWYTYTLGAKQMTKAPVEPGFASLFFAPDTSDQRIAWMDSQGGKSKLLMQNLNNSQTLTLATQAGLTNPVRWINDRLLIYRVATATESADYAVSPDGGQPHKITDVAPARGYSPF